MLMKSTSSSASSQVSKAITVGIDQGNQLWVMTAFDREINKKSRFAFKGKNKEIECYNKISELVKMGKDVSVCYEAGRCGFTAARVFNTLGCKNVRILPVNKVQILSTGKRPKTDNIDSEFLSEIDPDDKSIPSVWLPSIKQECLREVPREEQRLKRDISRNNNRIISILQRWPIDNINVHLTADEWKKELARWNKDKMIPTFLPKIEFMRIELMVNELELLEKNLKNWRNYMLELEKEQREQCAARNEVLFSMSSVNIVASVM
eukprot:TRINITY_DN806_c0_g1_i2.p1 TRINITY_DN806_c0_g1~~TRINITY_DN806_c0_g1_i2.p1  ORF type:complete len:264 (+),score=15.76 TRINITY_DN806_c0_g1_i2:248-1039(+)